MARAAPTAPTSPNGRIFKLQRNLMPPRDAPFSTPSAAEEPGSDVGSRRGHLDRCPAGDFLAQPARRIHSPIPRKRIAHHAAPYLVEPAHVCLLQRCVGNSCVEAKRAPSARLRSFAQTTSGATRPRPAEVSKSQSVRRHKVCAAAIGIDTCAPGSHRPEL